ncbi:hypothetical protein V8E36_003063 [Tilletia maclaganii]
MDCERSMHGVRAETGDGRSMEGRWYKNARWDQKPLTLVSLEAELVVVELGLRRDSIELGRSPDSRGSLVLVVLVDVLGLGELERLAVAVMDVVALALADAALGEGLRVLSLAVDKVLLDVTTVEAESVAYTVTLNTGEADRSLLALRDASLATGHIASAARAEAVVVRNAVETTFKASVQADGTVDEAGVTFCGAQQWLKSVASARLVRVLSRLDHTHIHNAHVSHATDPNQRSSASSKPQCRVPRAVCATKLDSRGIVL